jgi:hypothetical protein
MLVLFVYEIVLPVWWMFSQVYVLFLALCEYCVKNCDSGDFPVIAEYEALLSPRDFAIPHFEPHNKALYNWPLFAICICDAVY